MQIKDPKFKEGQKVRDIEDGDIYTVVEIDRYSFSGNEYWYELEADRKKYTYTRPESKLETYIDKPKTVWELQDGDACYFINVNGSVLPGPWDGNPLQIGSREICNVFLTKDEAETEVERRKIEAEMLRLGGRRTFKKGENNYYIVCDFDSHYDIWIYNNKSDGFGIGTIYFGSDNEAYNAIDSIGEDRIKKYIFGVES
ncbi:hypothetical protein [Absicoccus intestinalis]|uniref:DUF4178 domain-containing protein n=1 Tax=Absicoccus intestinalis TaxID=2926319 RepID=A0ABU4WJX9_9FIRM|nr:hypothetical protein [Absicoccus sp. CLA-KB-P134]MDX8416573.1 hypothetical protein [Absicoccus sp. CLA-KB-P134]